MGGFDDSLGIRPSLLVLLVTVACAAVDFVPAVVAADLGNFGGSKLSDLEKGGFKLLRSWTAGSAGLEVSSETSRMVC